MEQHQLMNLVTTALANKLLKKINLSEEIDEKRKTLELLKDGNTFLSHTMLDEVAEASVTKIVKGDEGNKGDQGIKGGIGPRGLKGDQGIKGDRGLKGGIGPRGLKGDQGIKGGIGPRGSKGDPGKSPKLTDINKIKTELFSTSKAIENKFETFKHEVMNTIDAIAWEGVGGGSYQLLDNQDVEYAAINTLTDNTILVYDSSKQKFVTAKMADIINSIRVELEAKFTKIVDPVDPSITYIGECLPGGDQADPVWRIAKHDSSDIEGDTITLWASGDAEFNKVWNDRISYTYS